MRPEALAALGAMAQGMEGAVAAAAAAAHTQQNAESAVARRAATRSRRVTQRLRRRRRVCGLRLATAVLLALSSAARFPTAGWWL